MNILKNIRKFPLKEKSGIASLIVIGLVVVIFILFGRMTYLMKQEAFMASHFHKKAVLFNIADAGAACGLNALDVMLNDPNDKLYKELSDPKNLKYNWDLATPIYPNGKYKIEALDDIVKEFPGAKLEVKAVVKYLTKFEPLENPPEAPGLYDGLKYIPKEKIGGLEVVATATFQNIKQVVREGRNIKVTCNTVPVFPRFSFFLQKSFKNSDLEKVPGDNSIITRNMNIISSSEKGSVDMNSKPFIIAGGRANPKTNGWIFMGQGDKKDNIKLILALSAGDSPKVGESFQLAPDYYKNEGLREGASSITFGGVYGGHKNATYLHPTDPNDLTYKTDTTGFFDSGQCKELDKLKGTLDPMGSGFLYSLNKKGRDKGNDPPLGSVLKIFGTTNHSNVDMNRSYMLMGNVFRAYTQIGVYQFDKQGGKWTTTGLFPFLTKASFKPFIKYLEKKVNAQSSTAMNNTHMTPAEKMLYVLSDKLLLDENKSYPLYDKFMTKTNYEFYISSASNTIVNEYSKNKLLPDQNNEWGSILPKEAMDIEQDYDKTLNRFYLPLEYFKTRETIEFNGKKGVVEFKKFMKDHNKGKLKLGMFVVVDAPKIEIPSISDIEHGGVIVTTGDMVINSIRSSKGTLSPEESGKKLLTLISLGGKIIIRGSEVNASIIALGKPSKHPDEDNDSIVKLNSKCDIYGNLIAGRINPENFAANGGTLYYNSAVLSPSKVNKSSYLVNDYAYCINLMPEISYWEVKSE